MSVELGRRVVQRARELQELGRDANQIAGMLCEQDPEGLNFGIGIVLGGDGSPLPTSPTLLEYAAAELRSSASGRYMSSGSSLEAFKERALSFQRVPRELWDRFVVALPSDAGTGAVRLALELALLRSDALTTLGVEELGWPAYRAMARSTGRRFAEYPCDAVIDEPGVLPLYQAGPMNTTGLVQSRELAESRAAAARRGGATVILDRAYPGFELARALRESGYAEVMRRSYELQLQPYLEAGVPCLIACSPTKAFVSFALRPCGVLLAFCPGDELATRTQLNTLMRARGSSFEHPATRAFVKASVERPEALEDEHAAVLARLAECEAAWRELSRGTPIEPLYGERYAGLFRNPHLREGGDEELYGRHIYPVISGGRCRHNVTGLFGNRERAAEHVAAFARWCYE
jgi:aspartate/tyrosine/aromatic aminotransferase